jgi:hypothetical protein
MHLSTMLWIVGGVLAVSVAALLAIVRRRPSDDLGSVSTAWTTEHNAGYHGGDGAANP